MGEDIGETHRYISAHYAPIIGWFHLGEKRRINPFTPVPKSIIASLGPGRGNGDCTVKKG